MGAGWDGRWRFEPEPFGSGGSVVCPSFFRSNLGESLCSTASGLEKMLDRVMGKQSRKFLRRQGML